MPQPTLVPRPLSDADLTALLGLVVVLDGELLGGGLDPRLVERLRVRCARAGLVAETSDPADLALALSGLVDRLRYSLGEYPEPLAADLGLSDQYFRFETRVAAERFLGRTLAAGGLGTGPVHVVGPEPPWEATVTIAELVLSAGFDRRVRELTADAARDGGSYGGWGSPPGSMHT